MQAPCHACCLQPPSELLCAVTHVLKRIPCNVLRYQENARNIVGTYGYLDSYFAPARVELTDTHRSKYEYPRFPILVACASPPGGSLIFTDLSLTRKKDPDMQRPQHAHTLYYRIVDPASHAGTEGHRDLPRKRHAPLRRAALIFPPAHASLTK